MIIKIADAATEAYYLEQKNGENITMDVLYKF